MAATVRLNVGRRLPAFDDWYPLYLRVLLVAVACFALSEFPFPDALAAADRQRLAVAWFAAIVVRCCVPAGAPVARYATQHVLLLRRIVNGTRLARASVSSSCAAVLRTGLLVWALTTGTTSVAWLPLVAVNTHVTLTLARCRSLVGGPVSPWWSRPILWAAVTGSLSFGAGTAALLGDERPIVLASTAMLGIVVVTMTLTRSAPLLRGAVMDAARRRAAATTAIQFADLDGWTTRMLRAAAGVSRRGVWLLVAAVVAAALLLGGATSGRAATATTFTAVAVSQLLFHPIRLDHGSTARRSLLSRSGSMTAGAARQASMAAAATAGVTMLVAVATSPPGATALWAVLGGGLVASDALRGGVDLGAMTELTGPEFVGVAAWVTALIPFVAVACAAVDSAVWTEIVGIVAALLISRRIRSWWRMTS